MASVSKSAVPASVSSIRELKSTVPVIDFHRLFEGRANIVFLSSFILAFFLCVICLFLFLSFRLGVALQRSFCISVFLSFRLGVALQRCFVLAVFLCCFLLAQLVIIHLFFFLSSVLPGASSCGLDMFSTDYLSVYCSTFDLYSFVFILFQRNS